MMTRTNQTLWRAVTLGAGLFLLATPSLQAQTKGAAPRRVGLATSQRPHAIAGGFDLPNGWRITPASKALATTGDLVLKMVTAPDGKAVIAVNSGYQAHGLTVLNPVTKTVVQRIALKTTWLGLAWSPDGKTLYVSGGNAAGAPVPSAAPIYLFDYRDGLLSAKPTGTLDETLPLDKVMWSGIAHHPSKPLVYAANRGVNDQPTYVAVFDANSHALLHRIPVEISPYELVFSADGARLFVSNWSSHSVSVIDTVTDEVITTVQVGANPNDMALSSDGRLFVACSADNSVHVIDTKTLSVTERLSTTLHPFSPEGSTPDALSIDAARHRLYVANADNNNVAVIDIAKPGHSDVLGFIPTGWYPAALTLAEKGDALYIGAAKGQAAYPDLHGPNSTLKDAPGESIKTLQTSTLERISLKDLDQRLPTLTKQTLANSPYNDELLTKARPSKTPSIIPSRVGAGSPIKHVIYIIRENRTYDQVLGDLPGTNGDPRLTLFGEKVTPNAHALAKQFGTFDNFYADGEVSIDGHSWSNSAYATDFNEKMWPANYGSHSKVASAPAYVPAGGHIWDLARAKGLTYRSYGEYAARVSDGTTMQAAAGVDGLIGHVAVDYLGFGARDTDNVKVFLREFDGFEAAFDSPDASQRLPNFTVMSMGEDHTRGATPGAFTPTAMVANNDWALAQLIDRVSHSKYWAQTAIFIVEDDAQDGADHVDARRTVALAISPYSRLGKVDSTLYSTSSMVRSIELLLGLPPMSQFDAAATPLYAAFANKPDLTPYSAIAPMVDVNAKNLVTAWGAEESAKMNLAEVDRAPMGRLNEIIWRSVKGPDAAMPTPIHRYRALLQGAHDDDD
jgi:YVTN family beta-propeller protein